MYFSAVIFLTTTLFGYVVGHPGHSHSVDVTVDTSLGNIVGRVEGIDFVGSEFDVTTFLGIPFAEPPTGTRRFNKPIEKAKFKDTFIAKTLPPQCVQNWKWIKLKGYDPAKMKQEEDCLYLNIFVPGGGPINKTEKRAVMIWIHGGGFQIGSQERYDAKTFVGLNDIILVTLNYRVSFLGFLSTHENNLSGNYGLWDQHMAIKWVHNHIESFGGDPMKVTLCGESAGAASVIYQALYEGNAGYFQRIIAQSGSVFSPWAYERNPSNFYHNFAKKSGCVTYNKRAMDTVECLRNLTIPQITEMVDLTDKFNPVIDGMFVKERPINIFSNSSNRAGNILRQFSQLHLMIGVTSSEGGLEIPTIDILTNTNATARPHGYSRKAFDTLIVPYGLKLAKLKNTKTLRDALLHQYVDWSDPKNTQNIFDNTVDLLSDVTINSGVIETAMRHSDASEIGNLFFYVFDHKSLWSDERLSGSTHTEEIPFVLGFPLYFRLRYLVNGIFTISQNETDLSKKLMKYWSNFAKTGDPNSDGLTHWPQYNSQTQKYIRFRADEQDFPVEDHFAARRMNFWHNLVPTLEQECDKTCPKCEDDTVSAGSWVRAGSVLVISVVTVVLLNIQLGHTDFEF